MKKKLIFSLLYFFICSLNGMLPEMDVRRLVHSDCFALQDDRHILTTRELRQRIVKLEDKQYSLDTKLNLVKLSLSLVTYHLFKKPDLVIDIYQTEYTPLALCATALTSYYFYSRNQALQEVHSNLLEELNSRRYPHPRVEPAKLLFTILNLCQMRSLRQH